MCWFATILTIRPLVVVKRLAVAAGPSCYQHTDRNTRGAERGGGRETHRQVSGSVITVRLGYTSANRININRGILHLKLIELIKCNA